MRMSIVNVELTDKLHRRLSVTAAAKGVTMRTALVEAASRWVAENAHHVAALGLADEPELPAAESNSDATREE